MIDYSKAEMMLEWLYKGWIQFAHLTERFDWKELTEETREFVASLKDYKCN